MLQFVTTIIQIINKDAYNIFLGFIIYLNLLCLFLPCLFLPCLFLPYHAMPNLSIWSISYLNLPCLPCLTLHVPWCTLSSLMLLWLWHTGRFLPAGCGPGGLSAGPGRSDLQSIHGNRLRWTHLCVSSIHALRSGPMVSRRPSCKRSPAWPPFPLCYMPRRRGASPLPMTVTCRSDRDRLERLVERLRQGGYLPVGAP